MLCRSTEVEEDWDTIVTQPSFVPYTQDAEYHTLTLPDQNIHIVDTEDEFNNVVTKLLLVSHVSHSCVLDPIPVSHSCVLCLVPASCVSFLRPVSRSCVMCLIPALCVPFLRPVSRSCILRPGSYTCVPFPYHMSPSCVMCPVPASCVPFLYSAHLLCSKILTVEWIQIHYPLL